MVGASPRYEPSGVVMKVFGRKNPHPMVWCIFIILINFLVLSVKVSPLEVLVKMGWFYILVCVICYSLIKNRV